MKRQDGIDYNVDVSDETPTPVSESSYSSVDYGKNGPMDTVRNLKKIPENVPRIATPDSPVPLVRRTKSDGVSQMVAGRSRKDLSCQNSMPTRKAVTFTKQDQVVYRAPRICRTPTPYARLDSGDIEVEMGDGTPSADENSHPTPKSIVPSPGNLENNY